MKWSGEAAVDVSVVNWVKGEAPGKKRLYAQKGNDPARGWSYRDLDTIGTALSFAVDVTQARTIQANAARGGCYQGQTHGHDGFLLTVGEAEWALKADKKNSSVLFPYLIANELIGRKDSLPTRYVIDFHPRGLLEAQTYKIPLAHVKKYVLPVRQAAAKEEEERNKEAVAANPSALVNQHHANFLKHWWLLSWARADMIRDIRALSRYIVCGQVTLRPIFEFVSCSIRPNAALIVFPYEDDYSFGILQSSVHWVWFTNRCSTLTGRFRYTSNTVFDSFPWPQAPSFGAVRKVSTMAATLRELRRGVMHEHDMSLRELYRMLDLPGRSPLKHAHDQLDQAVREAYGMSKTDDPLAFLFDLNESVSNRENGGGSVVGPGLPPIIKDDSKFVTTDCITLD
jgi:hypothetical protein